MKELSSLNLIYSTEHPWCGGKCKCLWGMRGKGRDSSHQKIASNTYTLRLDYSRISILYIYIYINLIYSDIMLNDHDLEEIGIVCLGRKKKFGCSLGIFRG